MTRLYYRDAVGCMILFDVTRQRTFEAMTKWKTDLDSKIRSANGNLLPCVLLANKVYRLRKIKNAYFVSYFQCDLPEGDFMPSAQQMDEFCRENGFAKWFKTSSKENINIEESFQYLIQQVKSL